MSVNVEHAVLKPLIVQGDMTILADTHATNFNEVSTLLNRFAALVKTPERYHTYQMSDLTLWNAANMGLSANEVCSVITMYAKYPPNQDMIRYITKVMGRVGKLKLVRDGDQHILKCDSAVLMNELLESTELQSWVHSTNGAHAIVSPLYRGILKRELARFGYPIIDEVGFEQGEGLDIQLRSSDENDSFHLRDYQQYAIDQFTRPEWIGGGSGVIVLPCGAGKTIVGIGTMATLGFETLVLTSSSSSVQQWKRELLHKTNLTEHQVGEYTGQHKQVRPVTIATYHILTYRKTKGGESEHFDLFEQRQWGLIVYDEVHLLPAPVFRMTADIQAKRRLGLTATLVREDGMEKDVFSLIGPKLFEVPWRTLEARGWIATVKCAEIQVPLCEQDFTRYCQLQPRLKHRFAAENVNKIVVVERILACHPHVQALIIGQYVDQLRAIAERFRAPLICGETPFADRERIFNRFRTGEIHIIVVSKVANFAIDLPDASLAIQVSGSFGSRQEEAQRLGRILRPKANRQGAHFYTIVSSNTCEEQFAKRRRMFLIEHGYSYRQLTDICFIQGGSSNEQTTSVDPDYPTGDRVETV